MTEVLQISDAHFGALEHSRQDPAGIPSALLSVDRCWNRAIDIALDREVDLVVLTGDQFHGKNPDAIALNLFAQGLRRLSGVPTLIIPGNHDAAAASGQQSILEIFADPISKVQVVTRPEVVEAGGLRVACLPWVSRQQLMARRPGITRAGAEQALMDGLVSILAELRVHDPDLLVAHWSVEGSMLQGVGLDISITGEPVLPRAELGGLGRVMLGHIHKRQDFAVPDGYAAYSGSLDRRNFGEEADYKTVIVWDLGSSDLDAMSYFDLPARRFVTMDPWEEGLNNADVDEAIVRVLGVPPANADVVRAKLLSMGAQIVYVHPLVDREVVRRAESVTETLTPTDALDQWMTLREIDEDRRPGIRETAKALITEPAP